MTTASTMTGRQRLLAALRADPVGRTPVWFMRQSGLALLAGADLQGTDVLAVQRDAARAGELAVLYADILLPVGVLDRLRIGDARTEPTYVLEVVRHIRNGLGDRAGVIGSAGGLSAWPPTSWRADRLGPSTGCVPCCTDDRRPGAGRWTRSPR